MTDKPERTSFMDSIGKGTVPIPKKIEIPNYFDTIQKENDDLIRRANENARKRAERQDKMDSTQLRQTELLEQIAVNTASLQEIATTLHESNMKQDEIVELMGDIFAIASAKDKATAENMYQRAIGKISSLGEQVGNIANLVTLATSVYHAVDSLIH